MSSNATLSSERGGRGKEGVVSRRYRSSLGMTVVRVVREEKAGAEVDSSGGWVTV